MSVVDGWDIRSNVDWAVCVDLWKNDAAHRDKEEPVEIGQ